MSRPVVRVLLLLTIWLVVGVLCYLSVSNGALDFYGTDGYRTPTSLLPLSRRPAWPVLFLFSLARQPGKLLLYHSHGVRFAFMGPVLSNLSTPDTFERFCRVFSIFNATVWVLVVFLVAQARAYWKRRRVTVKARLQLESTGV